MLETHTTQKATIQSTLKQHLMGTQQKPAETPHPTETCQDAAPHRNLQGCRIPEKPVRTPHPTETCEDAAPHRNLRGCWFTDQGRMRHFYPVVHFAFEGQAIKLTLLT